MHAADSCRGTVTVDLRRPRPRKTERRLQKKWLRRPKGHEFVRSAHGVLECGRYCDQPFPKTRPEGRPSEKCHRDGVDSQLFGAIPRSREIPRNSKIATAVGGVKCKGGIQRPFGGGISQFANQVRVPPHGVNRKFPYPSRNQRPSPTFRIAMKRGAGWVTKKMRKYGDAKPGRLELQASLGIIQVDELRAIQGRGVPRCGRGETKPRKFALLQARWCEANQLRAAKQIHDTNCRVKFTL